MIIGDCLIRRDLIPEIVAGWQDEIEFYFNCRNHGLPYGGGWATHPAHIIDLLNACDSVLAEKQKKAINGKTG